MSKMLKKADTAATPGVGETVIYRVPESQARVGRMAGYPALVMAPANADGALALLIFKGLDDTIELEGVPPYSVQNVRGWERREGGTGPETVKEIVDGLIAEHLKALDLRIAALEKNASAAPARQRSVRNRRG